MLHIVSHMPDGKMLKIISIPRVAIYNTKPRLLEVRLNDQEKTCNGTKVADVHHIFPRSQEDIR